MKKFNPRHNSNACIQKGVIKGWKDLDVGRVMGIYSSQTKR